MQAQDSDKNKAADIEKALKGIKYPTTRDEILNLVSGTDPHKLAEIMEDFPDQKIHSFEEIRRLMNEKKAGDL